MPRRSDEPRGRRHGKSSHHEQVNEGRSLPIVDSRRPECVERPFAKGLANGAEQSLLVVQKSKQSAQKLRRESSVALISGPVGEQSGKTRENSLPSRLYESIASSFRTICKIFAPRIDFKQHDRLRGVEVRCVKVRFRPWGPSGSGAMPRVSTAIFTRPGSGRSRSPADVGELCSRGPSASRGA